MEHDDPRQQAIAVIESLRAGVPTRATTRLLPDLRPRITELIKSDLEHCANRQVMPGRLLWGQYGQGKTHTLMTIAHLALDMGFAVSMVSLSREVSCHNLLHFYGRVAPMIRLPNSSALGIQRSLDRRSVSDLPEMLIQQPDRYVHPLPSIVLEAYLSDRTTGEEKDVLYGDLMGIRLPLGQLRSIYHKANPAIPFPRVERFRAGTHAKAYFGLMADVIGLCGYRGWVILIDEVELMARLGRASRLLAYRNLNWLLNWTAEAPYPMYSLGAAMSRLQTDTWFGAGRWGGNDRDILPQQAEEKFGQDARQEIVSFFQRAVGDACPTIQPVREEELVGLLERLVELHGVAHAWNANLDVRKVVRYIGDQPIRTHIRATLEALDQQYVSGIEVVPEAANLTEPTMEEDESFPASETEEPEDA